MRRNINILLVALLIFTMTLTSACQNNNASNNKDEPVANENSGNKEKVVEESNADTYPLTTEKQTLKVFAVQSPYVEDYETNDFTKWYEELTNVKVEWEFATPQESQEKLNLALSSGDLPDVIVGFGVSPAQQMVYGQQGIFLSLNDLIKKYGVETRALFDKYPEVKQATTAPDGNIYSLSGIDRNPHTNTRQKMWIYTPWLDKLNLKMPTTTAEFENVLKAFKTMDPNGNGKPDEIPMAGGIQDKFTYVDSFLMNSFIEHVPADGQLIFNKDGNVDVNFTKPEYKEGLQYLNGLYSQGLIAPESFTMNNAQLKAMVENGEPTVGVVSAFVPQVFSDITGARWHDFKTVAPLKGPSGLQQTPYRYYSFVGGNFLITSAAKDPEVAFRWMDGLYNTDITLRANIGTEGVGWKKPENGELGLNGQPAKWIRTLPFGKVQNNNWMQTTPYHFPREMFEGLAAGPNEIPRVLYEASINNYEPFKKKEFEVPPIFFDEQQSAELSNLKKTIMDYVDEMKTRFIIGDASIDKDWDKYLSTLDNMDLKRYLEINNTGYKAQYKK